MKKPKLEGVRRNSNTGQTNLIE